MKTPIMEQFFLIQDGNSPTFKITMKEYEDMAIKVGDKVTIEINKVDGNGT